MNEVILNRLRQNPKDLLVVASWFYKNGEPIISDAEYNVISDSIGDLDVVWDEVDAPCDIAKRYGFELPEFHFNTVSESPYFKEYMDTLYQAETKSVSPLYNMYEIYCKMLSLKSITDELCISLKVDGVSTRNIIELNEDGTWDLAASLSRSRESKGFDYTDGMRRVIGSGLRFNNDIGEEHESSGKQVLFAYGEAYVERSALNMLRSKYGKYDTWKTPRSTALSMLRSMVSIEDYKYLKFKCFKLSCGSTLSDMFDIATDAGLDVVPYEVIKSNDIPDDYNTWEQWFNNLLEKYRSIQESQDIESDGIVVAINNQNRFNSMGESNDGKYNNGMFSCKVGPWGSSLYYSTVHKILFENDGNTSEYSVVAEVDPVVVSTGNTVSRVNCFNLGILVRNHIIRGSRICFEYKSASSIVLVYD